MDPNNPFPWWQVRRIHLLNMSLSPKSQDHLFLSYRYSHAQREVLFQAKPSQEYALRIYTAMFIYSITAFERALCLPQD